MKASTKGRQNAIAYFRVSTKQQGQSGLGLEAQKTAVNTFASKNGYELVAPPFTEIETGTNKKTRPQLDAALNRCKKLDAVLLIAKLDRLARNVHFISGLMESGVKFVAVDMPQVDNLTIHILAAVAEQEAQLISKRTKAALTVKRDRDGEWRVSNLDEAARQRGAATMRQQAIDADQSVRFTASLLRQGGMSFAKIAEQLNENEYRTRQGKEFKAMTVKRILDRAELVA